MSKSTCSSWIRAAAFTLRLGVVVLGAVGFATSSAAFKSSGALDSLADREREVLDAIAARDSEVRDAALLATLYPDTLVHIELIQARSSAAFDLRVKQLDREHQEELWELVRAEGAIRQIVDGGPKDDEALDAIAASYPERIRAIFGHLGTEHFETLEDAHAIQSAAESEFDSELALLPEVPREAFRELLGDPKLLAMLGRSPSAVAQIGGAFDDDPERMIAYLDELSLEIADNNARSEEKWRESFDDDPEARADLERAARSYADEYDYDYEELTGSDVEVNVHVYRSPYPYWFGYPHWYANWDPWGVWYPVRPHFGFYYGHRHRSAIFFGLPSLHFVNWFYGGYYHRYPHLSRHIDHHHSVYSRAGWPLHRHARLRHDGRRPRADRWTPARLRPRAVHAEHRRQDRRERRFEHRENRRTHMEARRDTRRAHMEERRDIRRARAAARRDTRLDRREARRENATARRDTRLDRRDDRRERASARRSLRRDRASDRRDQRSERRQSRSRSRGPDSAGSLETSTEHRAERRDRTRERADSRRETRRETRAERKATRQIRASERKAARYAKAQLRAAERSARAARRGVERPRRERADRAPRPREVRSGPNRPSRERASRSERSGSRRERGARRGKRER